MAVAKAARKTARKAAAKKTTRGRASKGRLAPRTEKRGLEPAETPLALDAPELRALVECVRRVGGVPVGAYREPLAGGPLLLAELPVDAVDPTPFQRDLSPTHARRLAEKIEQTAAFLDPLIVVVGDDGRLWTPNGRHRLAAAKFLGMRAVSALVSADEKLAFKILPLNTEKAHNLRDRSLEVIRMARSLAKRSPRDKESDHAVDFEEPALLTLGAVYEQEDRFAGGAYHPLLRRVERWSSGGLANSLRERAGWAARLLEIDAEVKKVIEKLRERGFRSPYLRAFVVARINPLGAPRGRKPTGAPAMAIGAALTRMHAAAKRFDAAEVRQSDLALVAALAPEASE
jgi:ParB family chromosome partitioning protein